jgi:hypothetical protein
MTFDAARYSLDEPQPVEMSTLTDEHVTVVISVIAVAPDRVDLTGTITASAWDRVQQCGAFHVDLESGIMPGEPDADVEIALTLRRPVIELFADGDELFAAMFTESGMVLRRSESWLLASAMQRVDVPDAPGSTAASGFRTRWASPLF